LTVLILSILIALAAYALHARLRHRRLKSACVAAFASSFATASPAPTLEMSYSYGEPVFQVRFASRADLAAAAGSGANASFLRAIDALCRNRGRRRRPFRAERAVFFSHPPEEDPAGPQQPTHCCARMQAEADPANGGDPLIAYATASSAYGLRRGTSVVAIGFCPWCGTRLPGADQTKSRTR
jgi:hypothetical protein